MAFFLYVYNADVINALKEAVSMAVTRNIPEDKEWYHVRIFFLQHCRHVTSIAKYNETMNIIMTNVEFAIMVHKHIKEALSVCLYTAIDCTGNTEESLHETAEFLMFLAEQGVDRHEMADQLHRADRYRPDITARLREIYNEKTKNVSGLETLISDMVIKE